MKENKLNELLEISINASIEAGEQILEVYNKDFEVEYKDDNSPLTLADKRSHDVITSYLSKTDYPVLSEEGKSIPFKKRKDWKTFWIVDPLDGTKEFIKHNGEFTVNIALIENNIPVLGVIYIPVQQSLYFANVHLGSYKINHIVSTSNLNSLPDYLSKGKKLPLNDQNKTFTIVGSKSHMTKETEEFIQELEKVHGKIEVISKGSSLKICIVAEGKANIYPRFAPTMEWDVAAGHAIAKYAGKNIYIAKTNTELMYNTETLLNPWFIVK
ncbi:MAG: 3'(2'),5'-bisphosphate nucleotidase CysQ [Bacteroidales bacterium]|nr:3'(2'),5'-bisphosphate nucleotidase CysQ [Bacteroidales bacterium]